MRPRSRLSLAALNRPLPADEADELTWLLFRQDDVITVAQASRHLSRKAIRHRVVSGRWRQAHRGVLVTHNGPIGADQLRWIAVLATGERAVLGGLTAAQSWGLRRYDSSAIHLLLPAGQRADRPPPGVVVHRSRTLAEKDLLPVGRPPRTLPARSIVDAAQWARTDEEARAIIAAAFQQRLVAGDDLHQILLRMPRARRGALIARTAADAAGGAHSLAELDLLGLVRRAGLPEPSRQKIRYNAAGRRRYLDLHFDRWRLHIEVDGGQHLDPRTAWADMHRQNDLWIEGERILRFPAWAVRERSDQVVGQIRAALRSAGWPG